MRAAQKGLKMSRVHPFGHHSWTRIIFLENLGFDPFLTHFSVQNNPFERHFVTLEGPKWLAMGSKRAHFTCLGTPNGLGSFLEKHIFDAFDPFFVPKQPIPKAFWDFRRAKTGHHKLKTRQKHLFWHSMWSKFAPGGPC